MLKSRKAVLAVWAALAALALSGCTKSVRNYQIAECIGTLGQYENNEPVETPKMKAERERKESEAALEKRQEDALASAADLALSYRYEEAVTLLQDTDELQGDERAEAAIADYQRLQNSMYEYDGAIGHLCFTNLVTDTERAFDGDEYSSTYRQNMITLTEFRNILDALYLNGYILIDIHSLADETTDGVGEMTMTARKPVLPEGKKPLILSIENLNYGSVRNGDGVATRLALDKEGKAGAVYTDEGGHDLIGAYDVVPVLEEFIQEHPDFSFRDARGIIALSGSNGVFGYQIGEDGGQDYEENRQTVRAIADRLREDGWTFAAQGYSYQKMGDMSYESLREDIVQWQDTVGNVIGESDTLLYPYGSEVDYSTEKGALLTNQGFHYLVSLWSEGDHTEVNPTYLRQTRRTITGYVLENYPDNFRDFFSTTVILDPARK